MDDFIPTRGSQVKKRPTDDFKVVTYESYKSKKKHENTADDTKPKINSEGPELNMKRAKFEIIKFGMSGFDASKKEEAKIQLAIKLGAKPPKNKYKNYKLLIEQKKAEKKKVEKTTSLQQSGKNKLGKSTAKGKSYDRKRRKEKGGLLDVYGKVKPNKGMIKNK